MQIIVNDEVKVVQSGILVEILTELGYGSAKVATALDGMFIPASQRGQQTVQEGAILEILAPMQGG